MKITKANAAKALSEYLVDDLSRDISDGAVRMVVVGAGKLIGRKPQMIESLFDNPMVAAAVDADGDHISFDTIREVVDDIVRDMGSIPLEFPKIPLISPNGATIKMTGADFDKLFEHMKRLAE